MSIGKRFLLSWANLGSWEIMVPMNGRIPLHPFVTEWCEGFTSKVQWCLNSEWYTMKWYGILTCSAPAPPLLNWFSHWMSGNGQHLRKIIPTSSPTEAFAGAVLEICCHPVGDALATIGGAKRVLMHVQEDVHSLDPSQDAGSQWPLLVSKPWIYKHKYVHTHIYIYIYICEMICKSPSLIPS